ncbi:unnamed protein product, partial [Microthlaspi erraticum]
KLLRSKSSGSDGTGVDCSVWGSTGDGFFLFLFLFVFSIIGSPPKDLCGGDDISGQFRPSEFAVDQSFHFYL